MSSVVVFPPRRRSDGRRRPSSQARPTNQQRNAFSHQKSIKLMISPRSFYCLSLPPLWPNQLSFFHGANLKPNPRCWLNSATGFRYFPDQSKPLFVCSANRIKHESLKLVIITLTDSLIGQRLPPRLHRCEPGSESDCLFTENDKFRQMPWKHERMCRNDPVWGLGMCLHRCAWATTLCSTQRFKKSILPAS